ncbi:helix-turn-helix domain-containing protein [Cereibacter sphaeroides]|uniref:helix-turn-helix domain-containing protein n=1 Tax=Cereibacter sphaeroides TaxID=1063 RepID=UPI001F30D428|nr:helix-turn-helix transcriptional regulator [Cereibacter sphaeroides]MCE6958794.1 helix-turn-helix domain-containing protein [Cereibacter sphaeroides]MCE6973332.1 helix-turn-helix domain-containing protein [Cereibacter sphaeroides]
MKDVLTVYPDADLVFNVQNRGRPERNPRETAIRILCRQAFGKRMRELRDGADLSLSRAASLAGIASARKLSQYETTCYPPGDIVLRLAPHYGVKPKQLCELVLSHSDPEMYLGLTGRRGYEPSEEEIEAFLANPNPADAGTNAADA